MVARKTPLQVTRETWMRWGISATGILCHCSLGQIPISGGLQWTPHRKTFRLKTATEIPHLPVTKEERRKITSRLSKVAKHCRGQLVAIRSERLQLKQLAEWTFEGAVLRLLWSVSGWRLICQTQKVAHKLVWLASNGRVREVDGEGEKKVIGKFDLVMVLLLLLLLKPVRVEGKETKPPPTRRPIGGGRPTNKRLACGNVTCCWPLTNTMT